MIGLFGGTFNPIHSGHLRSVNLLNEVVGFDKVHWILSARPPHKGDISTSIEHRFSMLQLALQSDSDFVADGCEISRTEKSYTYTTIQHFRKRYPVQSLCLIIGGDSLQSLHTWYRFEDIVDEVHVIVMQRPGYVNDIPSFLSSRQVQSGSELQEFTSGKLLMFEGSDFDVSSTQLRQALNKCNTVDADLDLIENFIPKSVINYIRQHRLYSEIV